MAYYEGIEEAIRAAADISGPRPPGAERAVEPPVPLEAGVETLRVIEAARASSAERAVVPL